MSLLLLQAQNWDNPRCRVAAHSPSPTKNLQMDYLLSKLIQSQIRKNKAYTDISMFEDSLMIRYFIIYECPGYATRGLMSLNLKKITGEFYLQIDVLNPQNGYLKLDNRHQTIKVCKNLIFKQTYDKLLAKMAVNMETRQLKVHIPYLTHRFCYPFEYTYQLARDNLLFMFKTSIPVYIPYLQNVLQGILPLQRRKDANPLQNDLLGKIYKYSGMVMVASHLSDSMIEAEQQIVEKEKAKETSILRLCQNKQNIPTSLIKNCQLMCYTPDLNQQLHSAGDYHLGGQQLQAIMALTSMPQYQPRSNNINDNNLVLNNIIINTSTKIQLKKINQGGFCSIYLTELPFWYTQLSQKDKGFNRNQVMAEKKMLKKYCIIKLEEAAKKQKNRNQHQINIIKIMRNKTSIFLPKYYVPVNQRNPYPNSVVMDFTRSHNLGQHLIACKLTLSLSNKLFLMFSIIQSLRYIRNFKIVHLDIKPTNIMISNNLSIKLIDFGESYHPDLCKKNHKPGFTPPYSCPQMFQQGSKFTDKSDVFSLGVLFYQMIYGRFPFEIFKQKTNLQTEMKSYLNLWYFSSQEYQSYGASTVLRVLNNLLSKCLSMNAQQRPELDWLALIVRLCCQLAF